MVRVEWNNPPKELKKKKRELLATPRALDMPNTGYPSYWVILVGFPFSQELLSRFWLPSQFHRVPLTRPDCGAQVLTWHPPGACPDCVRGGCPQPRHTSWWLLAVYLYTPALGLFTECQQYWETTSLSVTWSWKSSSAVTLKCSRTLEC